MPSFSLYVSSCHKGLENTESEVVMALEMRLGRDGKLRSNWYGRYKVNNKRFTVNLGVKIAGTPPESLKIKDEGDAAYERSRFTAEAKLASIVEEARKKSGEVRLVEKIYEMKTGSALEFAQLKGLADEWELIPRKRKPSARYTKQCRATLDAFAAYVLSRNDVVRDLGQVTKSMARSFMHSESERKISPKTWNDTLKLLRTAFQHLLPRGTPNPFDGIPTRTTETVFRSPFTPEELKAILDTAQSHEFIRPIIITGICTAMRRGDCCLLQWDDVDFMSGFITVKTSKTGQTVDIPILPLLYEELSTWERNGKYVFPEQAAMYFENPDGITWRVKKVLLEAFSDDDDIDEMLPEMPKEETRKMAHAYIGGLDNTEKAAKMRRAFDLYFDGIPGKEILAEVAISKGTLSGYLNEIEAGASCRIVRGRAAKRSTSAKLKADTGLLQKSRDEGQRRASVRDFHSFRVTWVTLALTAGMPLEMVQKVTGHKTTEIVLKHYFQPGREDFRNALQSAMPKLLTESNGRAVAEPPIEYEMDQGPGEELGKAIEILEKVKSPKCGKQIKEAIQLIASAKGWYDSTVLREAVD
jgi:integrase